MKFIVFLYDENDFDVLIDDTNSTFNDTSDYVSYVSQSRWLPFEVIARHYDCNTIASCINKVEVRIHTDPMLHIEIDSFEYITRIDRGNITVWECDYSCTEDFITDLVTVTNDETGESINVWYSVDHFIGGAAFHLTLQLNHDDMMIMNME